MRLHKSWACAFAVAGVVAVSGSAEATLIHQWTFEDTVPLSGAINDSGSGDADVVMLQGSPPATIIANPVGSPIGLGAQSLSSGSADNTKNGTPNGNDQKASIYSNTGIAGLADTGGLSGLTLSAWVNRSSITTYEGNNAQTVVTLMRGNNDTNIGASGTGRASIQVLASTGQVAVSTREVDTTATSGTSSGTRILYTSPAGTDLVGTGQWVNLVAVFDYAGDTAGLYVNGVFIGSTSTGFNAAVTTNSSFVSNGIVIGGGNADPLVDQEFFPGNVDDVRIYNTALAGSEVLALYQAVVSPVPEPASLSVLAAGSLLLLRRRKTHV